MAATKKSPIIAVLRQLFFAPEPPKEQTASRIRFMERDVFLTIKIIVLAFLGFWLYFADIPVDQNIRDEVSLATVREAFLYYCGFNIVAILMLFGMHWIPLPVTQSLVFVANLTDGIFVAILVSLTGGLESAIYWVFLVLVIRNAVSVPFHRYQLLLNMLLVASYVFAAVIDRTWDELKTSQEEFEASFQQLSVNLDAHDEDTASPGPAVPFDASIVPALSTEYIIFARHRSPTNAATRMPKGIGAEADIDFGYALGAALLRFGSSQEWQPLLAQAMLLMLLSLCCYGINALWNEQLYVKEEEQEFAARQQQLRSTGRLAAEIAHQIKNPLAIINNAAFGLSRALKDEDEKILSKIEMIKEEVERSDRIVTELMGYAKLADGEVEKLDLHNELNRALNQVFPAAIKSEIKVTLECPEGSSPMLMQQNHLNEILVNLLTNAREVLAGNGKIDITADNHLSDRVILTVRDNGPGLRENQMEKIFEPYYSTKERGTGLGLAIVRHNIEIYGGSVEAQSELGKGTTFTLMFPYKVVVPLKS